MNIGIIGATGYGGAELLRLLNGHPEIDEVMLYSSSKEGLPIHEAYPQFAELFEQELQPLDLKKIASEVEAVFLSTPPGVSADISASLVDAGVSVIDLSGDLRLEDLAIYEAWYKRPAASQELIRQAVYGLSEWNRETIKSASVVANPGCYPTAVLLGLAPLVQADDIEVSSLVIDAKSGTSGAGRSPSAITHFSEMNENFKIYQVQTHKHTPEIEQQLHIWSGEQEAVSFQPHLVPMVRGIMATMYAKVKPGVTEERIRERYAQAYGNESFVRIRKAGSTPATKDVYGSNFCDIGIALDERTGRVTVASVIDNLVKGAAGQAIQNLNIMKGYEEQAGLTLAPVYP
ncbi:N-acetyl-gamma-glutamyl-phosphate reductase [Shouchella shacheensis]|uniref:N-acetyl-gamma-glutamyl-phosphate reductase n=1 Tax=Shouchella shacheensis TaxID=1649580 RepID=UPI00073FEFF3|nr:N-acetyl-gamma-glutamyl-phosphate reductase [Shouchella shacheensis]